MRRNHLLALLVCAVVLLSSVAGIAPSYAQGGGSTHEAILAQIPSMANFAQQAEQTFVGEVEGSYAYIGFVVQDSLAIVYICDGIGVYGWLRAEVVEGKISVADDKSGIQIVANVTAEGITGTVLLATDDDNTAPVEHNFATAPAVPGTTGLARYSTEIEVGGWIVTEHGIRGLKKTVNCFGFKQKVATLQNLLSRTSDKDVRVQLEDQIIETNLSAIIAGCGNVNT